MKAAPNTALILYQPPLVVHMVSGWTRSLWTAIETEGSRHPVYPANVPTAAVIAALQGEDAALSVRPVSASVSEARRAKACH